LCGPEGASVASISQLLELWQDRPDDGKFRKPRPPTKPTNIVYGVEDRPPAAVVWVAALQHVLIATTVGLFIPTLVLEAAHATHEATLHMTSVCMLALGVGTILACLKAPGLGSGYLMPASFSGVYYSVSILAAHQGGLPLVAGMTIFAGLVQFVLSGLVRRLRPYLPTEIAGFAMLMSGLTLAVVGFNLITGVSAASEAMEHGMGAPALLGVACVLAMVVVHVWGSPGWRIYTVLIGLGGGYVAALILGQVHWTDIRPAEVLHVPLSDFGWPTMAGNLMLPFAIAAVASSLRAIGDLTTAQRINDAKWLRPDMSSIRGGLAANGLATMISGLLGAVAIGTTSGSVGASAAAGLTSRIVGHATGALFIVIAFFPPIHDLLIAIPHAVMGAALLFSSCFINVSAMQVMTSRLMDVRRTLVIGIALLLAFSRFLFPGFYATAPHLLQPAVSSPLVIGLIGALLLNLVFRIGIKQSASIDYTPGADSLSKLEDFVERQGGIWGARRDVIERVVRALIETAECLELLITPGKSARVTMTFDEYWLDVATEYDGKPLVTTAAAPSHEELLADESQLTRLGVVMIRRQATRIATRTNGATQRIDLGFEH
jgi:NCS2 family nucleobase:cation symporter-2